MIVLWAGLLNWLATTILVESTLFAPVRGWIIREASVIRTREGLQHIGNRHTYVWPEGTTEEEVDAAHAGQFVSGWWGKLAQLVTCQLCMRVWVGFAEAAYFGGPDQGPLRLVANGLLFAAVGHLILEARSRLALVVPDGK